ncbi:MAG TPA: ATP-binding protein [Gemmatimonadaceae bacterium]|nr:ATP-binding protein [Gemmatimonadaceae bacterium]
MSLIGPLAQSLDALVQLVEQQSPDLLCSILLLEGDRLRFGAGPSLPEAYNQAIDGLPVGPAAGSCGTAAYRGEPVIVTDTLTDPLWADYRELADTHHLRACWSTPIRGGDRRVLGTFALYYHEPRRPAAADLQLIQSAAQVAATVIERYQAERERQGLLDRERAARNETQVAEARLREVFLRAPAMIATLRGPDHVFESANPRYLQAIGNRQILGKPLAQALPEVAGQDMSDLLDRVYRSGEPADANQLRVLLDRREDGMLDEAYFNFVYQPLFEADGAVSGILVHAVEVTELVRARRDAEEARSDAEHALDALRASELALRRAVESEQGARAEAEAANRAKSEFLAAMSHELRTPLNAIGGYVQLLEMGIHGPLTADQHEALARVQKSEEHLLALITDVLNFARLEAGRVEYEISDVPLANVVADAAPIVESQLAHKHIGYEARVAPGLTVCADADKLRQILLNLLSNAAKFTGAGGRVSVTATTRETGADGGRPGLVFLRVADTGIGIPREKQEAIFDPFVQAHRRLTNVTEGTGLGLAISRDLARGMGGDLRVRSTVDAGSSFTLTLRRASEPASA